MAKPAPLRRGGALDALRFLAAFCMVIHHYAGEAPIPLAKIHPVFERGYLATDFFLMVSGYVMGRIYGGRIAEGRIGVGEFFLRRIGRVVPAHLMMSAAFVGVLVLTHLIGVGPLHPEWFNWRELPGQVALVQAWGPFGGKGWNAPSWTLSALVACYLAFPWLWRRLQAVRSPVTALLLGAGSLALADLLTTRFLGYPVYQMPMHYGVVRAAPLFVAGACLALVSERLYVPPKAAVALGLGSLVLLAALQAVGRFDLLSLSLVALIILAAGAAPTRRPSKVLERAALVSFALFITNEFVRVIYFGAGHVLVARLGLSQSAQWAIWFGGPVVAVICALGFHYLIDWPSQIRIKAWMANGPARLKHSLAQMLPTPDPDFDPWGATEARAPRVREIVLQLGPTPGAAHRRGLDGPAGLAWG